MANEKVDSFTSKDGCKYSTDCPAQPVQGVAYCCLNCKDARAYFVTDANRHLWTDRGFWSKDGCRLPRSKMPPECLAYDCRDYLFLVVRKYGWGMQRWNNVVVTPLKHEEYSRLVELMELK